MRYDYQDHHNNPPHVKRSNRGLRFNANMKDGKSAVLSVLDAIETDHDKLQSCRQWLEEHRPSWGDLE
jgi:hypothetical protein